MQRGILLSGAVLVAGVAARNRDYSDLAVGAAGLGARLVNMRHGRGAELEADAYGMAYMSRAGYDPRAAIDLQRTFLRLSEGRDTGGWLSGLFRSHPPSSERVAANEQTARSLPASGTLGRDAYMNATAGLRRARPGYEALDRATEALANGNLVLARQEARAAEEIIPDEATVASLLGDIEIAASAPEAAIAHYDRALRLDSGFFYSNLARGEANLALARLAPAESDFERSLELLPTSRAYLGLGRIAEAEGNRGLAIEHYTRAAESSGSTGIAARMALIRLDLPENPERYLSVASSIDANGQLIVEVRNRSLLAVTGIELDISYVSGGQVRAASQSVAGVLEPDVSRRIATGLGPFASSADFQVAIERALAADNE